MAMDDLVWLTHPETGGINQFAVGALEAWTARGWVPCEPPAETEDHLRDPVAQPADPAPESQSDGEEQDAGSDSTPEPTSRARRGTTPKE